MDDRSKELGGALGGSWVVMNRVTIIAVLRVLLILLLATHEPPSRVLVLVRVQKSVLASGLCLTF